MSAVSLSRSERIARLNDRARQAIGLACVAVATEGFRSLPEAEQSRVRELVETYDSFTPDNDPYGERDFGAIYRDADGRWSTGYPVQGKPTEKVFWKIDAYDRALRFGSEDLANPAVTRRVLTIMLASEY